MLQAKDEEDAYSKHESALTQIEAIVKSDPPDLRDLAWTLVRRLLFLDNRFDMEVSLPGWWLKTNVVEERNIAVVRIWLFSRKVSFSNTINILYILYSGLSSRT